MLRFFFFNDTATTEIYTLSLHDALPITSLPMAANCVSAARVPGGTYQLVRQRWAGSLLEDAVLEPAPALLTVATDAGAASLAAEPAEITVRTWRPDLAGDDVAVCATESAERAGGVSLATARVVVGGGRGVGGPEGFGALEELAGLLGGDRKSTRLNS